MTLQQESQQNHLRRWRSANGLTLAEIAGLTGLSAAMVSRVERGERSLKPLTKIRLARLLDVPVDDLFPVAVLEEATADA